ncbi:hypothetical protein Bbelb_098010 [Branchiostoma belcheri]|nr:hypothetical protein Bbelb_098010 [Branchiostoma belcheri]
MPAATESTPGTKIIQPRRHKGRVVVWEDLSVNHMDAIDQATSADDLRSILGQIFGMSDHRDNLKNGVLMDLFVYTILYARRQNFNKEQTSAFFSIVKRTHGVCVETPFGNVQECYNYFTELLLCHGTKRPPFSVDLFDADQVRNITDYVVNTYFRHFKLYKYVFTPKVQLDLTMKYVGIPETPQPMEEQQEEPQEGNMANLVLIFTLKSFPESKSANRYQTVESPRKKELRTLIQSQLAGQVKELRMSVDEQLKINDQVLMQKLAALGEGDSSKGGRTSSRGDKPTSWLKQTIAQSGQDMRDVITIIAQETNMAARNLRVSTNATCLRCQKLFTRQKKLPCGCGLTFCHYCAQRIAGGNLAFQCEFCDQPVQLLPGGVSDLPDIYIKDALGVFWFGRPPMLERTLRTGPIREISNPFGIAVSGFTQCFVADYDQQNIQVLSFDGKSVHHFPTIVPGDDGQNIYPEDITKDEEGNLWVVGNKVRERSTGFAVQYKTDGQVLRHFELPRSEYLRGLAVYTKSSRNLILVTHRGWKLNNTPQPTAGAVHVYSPDGTRVKIVRTKGMDFPQYITVDWQGRILVADDDSYSVYVFNEDGEFLFQFGKGILLDPCGICTDVQGNIIVADQENGQIMRVKVFDRLGNCIKSTTTDVVGPQAVARTPGPQLLVVVDNVNKELAFLKA